MVDVDWGVAVVDHLGDLLNLLLGELSAAFEEFLDTKILRSIEKSGFGGMAVATGAAHLLIVGIQRVTDISVEDETDIALIDAHAKCICGDNYIRTSAHEIALDLIALRRLQSAVIVDDADSVF